MKYILCLMLITFFGCSMPATTVRSVDSRPSIAIEGGSSDSELFINGKGVGKTSAFDGHPNVLTIEPGSHTIVVKSNGSIVYQQDFFVESELKTFKIK